MDVEISELEKIDADRMDGVGGPATGIPILLMKSLAEPAEKDWTDWDAAHEGGGKGKPSAAGDSKASAADAVARARQTIADHKAGKKVSAAELKNAHEVHEAHLAHEAKLKAEAKAKDSAAKPAAKKDVAKGARDCPKCDKSYDADHQGSKCENCGTDLPDAPAAKSELEETRELVKAIVARKVDEAPDIAGGTAVIAQIADLIIAEAQELKAGNTGEISDIQQLACAAEMIWCWRTGEESVAAGSVMPATALMQSAAKGACGANCGPDCDSPYHDGHRDGWSAGYDRATADVAKAKHSAADRKKLAEQGNALSDGSYPIADEEDLKSAAILAQSGHGDVDGAKRLIGRRAKELGVKNPLEGDSGDTAKSQIATEGTTVDTVTQTGDLAEVVKAADAKAAALEKRVAEQDSVIKALEGRLAKVEAAPVLGGPVMSAVRPARADSEDHAAKARYYDEWAERLSDPSEQANYRQLAARERAKITVS